MTHFIVRYGDVITAMVVFAGLWLYMLSLDSKVNSLKRELTDEDNDS